MSYPSRSALYVLNQHDSTGSTVAIERDGDDYWLKQDLGTNQNLEIQLRDNSGLHSLALAQVVEDDGTNIIDVLSDNNSIWEYALFPNGAADFVGNRHGGDTQTDLSILVDGVDYSAMTDGQEFSGSTAVIITRTTELEYPPTTKIADVVTTYTLTPDTGLLVDVAFTFAATITIDLFYIGMLPVNDAFGTGIINGDYRHFDLSGDPGPSSVLHGYDRSSLANIFEHHWSAMIYIAKYSNVLILQDRCGGELNKAYFRVSASAVEYADLDEVNISVRYKMHRFDNPGADPGYGLM